MSTSTLSGTNFSLDGRTIDFFGVKGYRDGDDWIMNMFLGAFASVSHDTGYAEQIQGYIANDESKGNGDKVALVVASANMGVCLFLDGVITAEHLAHAVGSDEHVDIPGVQIGERTLTVRVKPEVNALLATADAEGNILP